MNFEELLSYLGEQWADRPLYSVEDRDMTNHETTILYFMEKDEAIAYAEQLWAQISADDRDYRDISVHRGEIEYMAQLPNNSGSCKKKTIWQPVCQRKTPWLRQKKSLMHCTQCSQWSSSVCLPALTTHLH